MNQNICPDGKKYYCAGRNKEFPSSNLASALYIIELDAAGKSEESYLTLLSDEESYFNREDALESADMRLYLSSLR